ncbi:MAG: histidinol dehydrogenase [Acidimicrobiia bacterium]
MLQLLDLRGRPDPAGAFATAPGTTSGSGDDAALASVRAIIDDVRTRGDVALRELTAKFDGCEIDDLRVPAAEIQAAFDAASPELKAALDVAATRIRDYHAGQAGPAHAEIDADGISVRELTLPVGRAGCYVPGGRASYPSTVLMTAIPARVAGVPEVVLCVPPGPDGHVPQATLAAAAIAGVDAVYRVGGAQAIAALAYGTDTIGAVDVIVGPGNAYVALAKREVAGVVGIDSFAGPSEVVVLADASLPPEFAAADLLAQAEHGPGGAAVLVAWDAAVVDGVNAAVERLAAVAPRRDEIESTLASGGRAVLVDDAAAALAVVNEIAPEHLELLVDDPDALVPGVRNAGAVFCGPWAPAALGDYVAGVNHVLPTARTARFASALRVDTFRKHVHVVRATEAGLAGVAPALEALAAAEGLDAHASSVALRRAFPGAGSNGATQ